VAASRIPVTAPSDTMDMDVDTPQDHMEEDEHRLAAGLKAPYGSSNGPNRSFRIPHSISARDGTGTLIVPGWILSRVAEILFEVEDDLESETVPDAVLSTLLKVSF
jgi:hypothetical protein